jgi:hypothetical protein
MAASIRRVDYFYTLVKDKPGTGFQLMERLKEKGINLVAFTAFPFGTDQSQLDFIPESAEQLLKAVADEGVALVGPKKAFLIQGEDKVGTLADIHHKLFDVHINVTAANGVSDGTGRYGYILWVKPKDFEAAAQALGV